MKTLTLIIIGISLIMISSCNSNPFVVTDNYVIYSEDEYGNGYYLKCKLGCDQDARIEYVKSIKWSDKYLFVQQKNGEQNIQWYIIEAKGEKLLCCNNDTLIGPFTEKQVEKYMSEHGIVKLKEKHF